MILCQRGCCFFLGPLRGWAWRSLASLEIGLGSLLLIGDPYQLSSLLSAILLSLFLIYSVVLELRGATGECGCFGHFLSETLGTTVIVRNVILTGFAWTVVVLSIPGFSGSDLSSGETVAVLFFGAMTVAMYFGVRLAVLYLRTAPDSTNQKTHRTNYLSNNIKSVAGGH